MRRLFLLGIGFALGTAAAVYLAAREDLESEQRALTHSKPGASSETGSTG